MPLIVLLIVCCILQVPTASGRNYRLLTGGMKNSVDWILAEATKQEQGHIIPGRSFIIAWLKGQNLRRVKEPNLCEHCLKLDELNGSTYIGVGFFFGSMSDFYC